MQPWSTNFTKHKKQKFTKWGHARREQLGPTYKYLKKQKPLQSHLIVPIYTISPIYIYIFTKQ